MVEHAVLCLLPLQTLAQVESGESSAAPLSATVFSPNVLPKDPPYVCKEQCDGTWVCQPQEGDPPTSSLGEGGGDCGTCDGGSDASAESGGAGAIRVDPGCLHIEFELGGPRFPGALKPGALLLYAEELSPTVLTPEGLSYRYAGLLMKLKKPGEAVEPPPAQSKLGLVSPWGQYMTFTNVIASASLSVFYPTYRSRILRIFGPGSSGSGGIELYGGPSGAGDNGYYLVYGNLIAERYVLEPPQAPGYWPAWRMGTLADVREPYGRVHTLDNAGIKIVRASATGLGAIRQILAPQCAVDIEAYAAQPDSAGYEVRYYTPDAVGARQMDGTYAFTANPFAVVSVVGAVRAGMSGSLVVTRTCGEVVTDQYTINYTAYSKKWTITSSLGDDGPARSQSVWRQGTDAEYDEIVETRDGAGTLVESHSRHVATLPSGPTTTARRRDPGGADLHADWTYVNEASRNGRHGCVLTRQDSDGGWAKYEYDANGRRTRRTDPWKDNTISQAGVTNRITDWTYGSGSPMELRPNARTTSVGGTVTAQTTWQYGAAAWTEEQVAGPGLPNLRTRATFYAAAEPYPLAGLLKTVEYPDGRVDAFTNTLGTVVVAQDGVPTFAPDAAGSNYARTVTHGVAGATNGVPLRTTRERRVYDARGMLILEESWVCAADGAFERLGWTRHVYDSRCRRTQSFTANGTQKTCEWADTRKHRETDEAGGLTEYTHDGWGRLVARVRRGVAAGAEHPAQPDRATLLTYDVADRLLTETASGDGETLLSVSNAWNVAGQLLRTLDAAGLVTQYAHDEGQRRETVTRPGGATELTERYRDGRVKSVTGTAVVARYYDHGVYTNGLAWTFERTGAANSPRWERTVSDALGRTVRTEAPAFGGGVATNGFTYNGKGQLVRTTRPGTAATLYAFDELGAQVLSGLDVDGNGALAALSSDRMSSNDVRYAKLGDVWWRESRRWVWPQTNSAVATPLGLEREQVGGSGCACQAQRWQSVDIRGNLTERTVAIDREAKRVTTSLRYPDSTNAEVSVEVNGLLISRTGKTGHTTRFEHDGFGRQVAVIDARTGTATTHYNAKGQVDWVEDAAGRRTSFAYEPATGQRSATVDALGHAVHYAFDRKGQPLGRCGATYPVFYGYDEYGRMNAMYTLRDSSLVVNGYADFEAHAGSFDATRWLYDEATGLLTNKVYADGRGTAYRYTPDGKLETRNWARGVTTDYAYDPATRELVGIDYSDATPDVNLAYDRLGRQVRVMAAGVSTNLFAYDPATLALTNECVQTPGSELRILRSQDGLGRPAGLSLGPDYSVRYGYDAWGRFASLSSVIGPLSSSNLFTYAYLPDSDLLAGYVATNPVSSFQFQVSRAYEPHRDLLTMVSNAWDAALSSAYAYQNDAVGRRVQRVDAVGGSGSTPTATNRLAYNLRSEVTNAVMPMGSATNLYAYRYDPIGNRTHSVSNAEALLYTANELNQYSRIYPAEGGVGTLPVYDADGNMVACGDWVYGWDAENRLISAEPAAPQPGDKKVELAYDFMSRRVSKSTLQYDLSGWDVVEEKDFVYDGWAMIAESIESAGLPSTNRYVYGLDLSGMAAEGHVSRRSGITWQGAGGIGGLLLSDLDGTAVLYGYDANGNVTELVGTDGAVVARYAYDPFGNTILAEDVNSSGIVQDNPFRFSTKYQDVETGDYNFGFRLYRPPLGRWLSRDPIGERGGWNVNALAGNDLVDRVDLLGLDCTTYLIVGHGYDVVSSSDEVSEWLDNQRRLIVLHKQQRDRGNRAGTYGREQLGPEISLGSCDTLGAVSCFRDTVNARIEKTSGLRDRIIRDIPRVPGMIWNMPESEFDRLLLKPDPGYAVQRDEEQGDVYLLKTDTKLGPQKIKRSGLVSVAWKAALDSAVREARDYKCGGLSSSYDCCSKSPGYVTIKTVCLDPNMGIQSIALGGRAPMERVGLGRECGMVRRYDCKTGQLSEPMKP